MTPSAKLLCLVACAASCLAQDPAALVEKAPPGIDEALRARVTKFYQAYVDGKFREAYEMVAEDSKDAFFTADRRSVRGFEIRAIAYSDQFARARVVVNLDTDMPMPGGLPMRFKLPTASTWKRDGATWYWHVEAGSALETPFGSMKASPGNAETPNVPFRIPTAAELARGGDLVETDRGEVHFKAGEPATEEVVISNRMPGPVWLSLEDKLRPDLEVQLDREQLPANESAKMSIRYRPSAGLPPAEHEVRILVKPTGRALPIRIVVSPSRPGSTN